MICHIQCMRYSVRIPQLCTWLIFVSQRIYRYIEVYTLYVTVHTCLKFSNHETREYVLYTYMNIHGTTMLWYEIMSYGTGPPKYAIFSVYSWYLLTWATGHYPEKFSFLEIRAVCTDINWVETSQDQVPITLIFKKLNSLGLWPDVRDSRYQEYTEKIAYLGGPVLYAIIMYHSIVVPCTYHVHTSI